MEAHGEDQRIICRIDPFTTHLHYRGDEIPIGDVLLALKLMPQLKLLCRALRDPAPKTLPKPVKRKRRGR